MLLFAFKSTNFAQIIKRIARICVLTSSAFRSSALTCHFPCVPLQPAWQVEGPYQVEEGPLAWQVEGPLSLPVTDRELDRQTEIVLRYFIETETELSGPCLLFFCCYCAICEIIACINIGAKLNKFCTLFNKIIKKKKLALD